MFEIKIVRCTNSRNIICNGSKCKKIEKYVEKLYPPINWDGNEIIHINRNYENYIRKGTQFAILTINTTFQYHFCYSCIDDLFEEVKGLKAKLDKRLWILK